VKQHATLQVLKTKSTFAWLGGRDSCPRTDRREERGPEHGPSSQILLVE
jgi:hypothetical protein